MYQIIRKACLLTALTCSLHLSSLEAQTITEILDDTGDGLGNLLDRPYSLTTDAAGNVYVGATSRNVFKVTPGGTVTELIDETGDGTNIIGGVTAVTTDSSGNVFATGGNVFKIETGGTISQILDADGDGSGNSLSGATDMTSDSDGNIYVAGGATDNVFKVTPGGVKTVILDAAGDGAGNLLDLPQSLAVDGDGNVYVASRLTSAVFKVTPGGVKSVIIDASGDESGNTLAAPYSVAVDASGNVYVAGFSSRNAFKITSAGVITEIIDSTGDGTTSLLTPHGIAVDASGNVFVASRNGSNIFRITPAGAINEIITSAGDGAGATLSSVYAVTTDSSGNIFATGHGTDNVFKITPDATPPTISTISIPNSAHKVGDTVTATLTVTSDTDDYTTGGGGIAGSINGYAIENLSKTNDTTYTATFTITDGGTDIAAGSNVPVNITLTDSWSNASSAFTTAISQASDAIYANIPDVALTSDTATIAEDGGVATLTATLSGSLNNQWPAAVTVNLAYTGTATAATDYAKSDNIIVSAGTSSNSATITATADSLYDAASAETVIVDISSLSAGNEGAPNQQTLNITDAESGPTVSLSVGNSSIAENGGTSTITATLSHPTFAAVTVNLAFSGTATSGGTDYNVPSSSITIPALSTNANAVTGITAVDDGSADGALTVVIDVSTVSGGGATENGVQVQTVTINDDENADPEVASSIGPQSGTSGQPFNKDISASFSDPNGDDLSFTATGLPGGLSISTEGVISGTIQSGLSGDFDVTVTASDPSGATIEDDFVFTVNAPSTPGAGPEVDPEPETPTDSGLMPPLLDTAESDGNDTSTQIAGGVTKGNGIFEERGQVEVGDEIEIIASIAPDADHYDEQVGIIIAILDPENPEVILLVNAQGEFVFFDGINVVYSDVIALAPNNIIDITGGNPITLTAAEIGIYNIFVGYQFLSGGAIYYNSEPIVVDVLQ